MQLAHWEYAKEFFLNDMKRRMDYPNDNKYAPLTILKENNEARYE